MFPIFCESHFFLISSLHARKEKKRRTGRSPREEEEEEEQGGGWLVVSPFTSSRPAYSTMNSSKAIAYWENSSSRRKHKYLAPLLLKHGDAKGGLRQVRAAAEMNPTDSDIANDFGLALYEAGKWDRAIEE